MSTKAAAQSATTADLLSAGRVIMSRAKKKKKSILSLGGIAKGQKSGTGNEREYTKKKVSKKIAEEGLKKIPTLSIID